MVPHLNNLETLCWLLINCGINVALMWGVWLCMLLKHVYTAFCCDFNRCAYSFCFTMCWNSRWSKAWKLTGKVKEAGRVPPHQAPIPGESYSLHSWEHYVGTHTFACTHMGTNPKPQSKGKGWGQYDLQGNTLVHLQIHLYTYYLYTQCWTRL